MFAAYIFIVTLTLFVDALVNFLFVRFSRQTRFVVYLRDQFNPDIPLPFYCSSYREAKAYALEYPDRFLRIDVFQFIVSLRKVKVPRSTK